MSKWQAWMITEWVETVNRKSRKSGVYKFVVLKLRVIYNIGVAGSILEDDYIQMNPKNIVKIGLAKELAGHDEMYELHSLNVVLDVVDKWKRMVYYKAK